MINNFRQWLSDLLKPPRRIPVGNIGSQRPVRRASSLVNYDDELDSREAFTFRVFNAQGGKIIEFRTYNEKTDENLSKLHIIGDDENFSEELGKIVMYEILRA